MSLNLTNLSYSEKNIGATLKISKRQFIWEFDLNGSSHKIELLDSRLSNKKRLFKNGINILDTKESGNFIHNFEIDGHACVIIQYGDKIELRIDNQSFTHLYNLQKNKELFEGEKGPTSNVYIAKPSSSDDQKDGSMFYKINKPEEKEKPKLFNFEIKNDGGNKQPHGFKSKFKFGSNKIVSPNNSNQNNTNTINNTTNNNTNNNNNQDLLGFQDNSNNSNQVNNDLFNVFGNNNQNQNQMNNIFPQIDDGNSQQMKFDQNNLGFIGFNDLNNNKNDNSQNKQSSQGNNNMNLLNF